MLPHSLGLRATPALAPTLSPRLQQAVRLLQLSSQDFALVVRQALDSNPFLSSDDLLADAPSPGSAGDEDRLDTGDDWGEGGDAWPAAGGRADGSEGSGFDTLAAPARLGEHLASQLRVMRLDERELLLAVAVAHGLDDDGYLRMSLDEVGAVLGLSPPADAGELALALRRVQALEPAGVGARSLGECLLLQLPLPTAPPGPAQAHTGDPLALARLLVREHLPALAGRDPGALARRLRVPRAALDAALARVRRLDPRPGWRVVPSGASYVTPDVIVRRQRGQWVVHLNAAVMPRLRLHQDYAQLFIRHRQPCHAELGAQLQEARWLVRNVEQRFTTILEVARAIVQRQHRFLAYGPMAMQPLALREIARAVGVHESTVSRVTNNKYMATPGGVFELRHFFSRGLATAGGGACSPTAVRGLIRDLIAAEAPGAPLSDVALARALALQGLQVARRTVTKYRQELRIEPAERRCSSIR